MLKLILCGYTIIFYKKKHGKSLLVLKKTYIFAIVILKTIFLP